MGILHENNSIEKIEAPLACSSTSESQKVRMGGGMCKQQVGVRQLPFPVIRKHSISGILEPSAGDEAIAFGLSGMQGYRKNMEDATVSVKLDLSAATNADPSLPRLPVDHSLSLFAVFDGHGGSFVARSCARVLAPALTDNLRQQMQNQPHTFSVTSVPSPELVSRALVEIYEKLDMALAADTRRNAAYRCGSTAVSAVVTENHIICANIGDSRCVLSRCSDRLVTRKGRKPKNCPAVVPLSHDHKPLCSGEKSRIQRAGGKVVNGRVQGQLAVSRAFGDFYFKGGFPQINCNRYGIALCRDSKQNGNVIKSIISGRDSSIMSPEEEGDENDRFLMNSYSGQYSIKKKIGSSRLQQQPEADKAAKAEMEATRIAARAKMVVATPTIVATPRSEEDEFLVLACDGVFDVMSNTAVCDFVRKRFHVAEVNSAFHERMGEGGCGRRRSSRSRRASVGCRSDELCMQVGEALLDACLKKGSTDNMSVIIVDLRRKVHGKAVKSTGKKKKDEMQDE